MKPEWSTMGEIVWEERDEIWNIRHIQDTGIPPLELRKLEKLEELEEVVRWDSQGRYRPLRSGGNLVSGWVFWARGESKFREAIEVIYPGLWGNAEAWRKGKLKVDPWETALAQQTERVQKKNRPCRRPA